MDADERRARATGEASYWWAQLGTRQPDEIPRADREQFTRWLRESPLHVAELLRIAHVHDALHRFKLWDEVPTDSGDDTDGNVIPLVRAAGEPLSPETEEADQSGHATKKAGRRLWTLPRTIALAASLVLTAIAATWLLLAAHGKVVATERTERRELMLSDGSIVQLEPETTLRVRFRTDERLVVLERGRALFRVAKNPRRPFLVHADGATVRAVGTAFGVEHRPAGIVVTVAEGSVAITAQGSGRESLLAPRAIATPVQLITAGEQLTVQSSGATQRVRQVDTARALAWAEGRLVFENDTLADVIAEFNRYNRTRLRIADPKLAARRVSGVFEATDTETLLAFIRAGTRVAVTRQGDDEISITAVP